MKFGRTYNLSVMGRSGNMIPLAFPLTLKFDVTHNTFSDANNASLQIYNISTSHQKEIYWDQYFKATRVPLILNAGYRDSAPSIPQIFTGYVTFAYTERLGPDTVTHIEAYDGGFGIANGVISHTANIGDSVEKIFSDVVSKGLPGVTKGSVVITKPNPKLTSPWIFSGPTWPEIQKLKPDGGSCFIADGEAHLLGFNDTLPKKNSLGVLQSSTGLLGVPKREGYQVTCSCIFEPRMKLGQTVELKSSLNPWVNKVYQIIGFKHHGTISAVESGEATTDITLLSPDAPQP